MDKYWKPEMNLDEGLELIQRVRNCWLFFLYCSLFSNHLFFKHYAWACQKSQCITEINTRMVVNTPNFFVKIADKDGVREIQLPPKKDAAAAAARAD
jgi:hypothetical protein